MNKTERLISFTSLLKESFDHFGKVRSTIFKVFGIIVAGMVIFQLISTYLSVYIMDSYILAWSFILIYILFLIATAVLAIGFTATLKKKKSVPVKRVFNRGIKLIIPSIWVSMILIIVQIGSFALLLVPGIIISGYLIFAKLSVLIDSKRGFEALTYSFNLVRGYWFEILWKIVLAILALYLIVVIILTLLLTFVGMNIYFDIIFSVINYMFLVPFFIIYIYELYREVKTRPRIDTKFDIPKLIKRLTVWGSIVTIIFSITMIYLG